MGNTACCEQARENEGPFHELENQVHKQSPSSQIKKTGEVDHHHEHPHNQAEHEDRSPMRVEQNKYEMEEILQEVQLKDPLSQNIPSQEVVLKQEQPTIEIPKLSTKITEVIEHNHWFGKQLQSLAPHCRKYHNDVYVGALDEETDRPNGFGKMYKDDGSLYIGHFQNGKAQGLGAFIFPNGSYYNGQFRDNKAETNHGIFQSQNVKYTGGFKNNSYHGLGKEVGMNYEFDGEYNKGIKVKGIFKWRALDGAYEYEGSFNSQNKFHATGILREPYGVYEGEFVDGEKHGHGYFRSESGHRYKGDYIHDAKTGKGAIYDNNNELIYEGEVQNGLPHGRGKGLRDGKLVESVWDQGIELDLIS